MTRPVVVLGSTGSIGTQTLEVIANLGMRVHTLAANQPSAALMKQAEEYPDAKIVVAGGSNPELEEFATRLGGRARFGSAAVADAAATPGTVVINGIVGSAGLAATLSALEAGNRVGLANKESLVAGGPLVRQVLQEGSGELLPVDSEHSALYQCLLGETADDVARLMLTASGGPFRGRKREDLVDVTPEQALAHPTWDMGSRISIDSATLFNKGLEVIEAHYLFDIGFDRIDVVVHPQSVIHSMIEFVDGSWKAHLGHADMRIPIQYSLTAPERAPGPAESFDFTDLSLDFEAPDRSAFPALDLAFSAGRQGGSAPAVLNAADEVSVAAFLEERLGFLGITDVVAQTLEAVDWRQIETFEDVVDVDREARSCAGALIAGMR